MKIVYQEPKLFVDQRRILRRDEFSNLICSDIVIDLILFFDNCIIFSFNLIDEEIEKSDKKNFIYK